MHVIEIYPRIHYTFIIVLLLNYVCFVFTCMLYVYFIKRPFNVQMSWKLSLHIH